MMKTKAAPAAASMPADGMVEGYAATFDRIPDAYGDVIAQGAFAETVKAWEESGKPIPLLYGHSTDDPQYNIGKVVEAREDEICALLKGDGSLASVRLTRHRDERS